MSEVLGETPQACCRLARKIMANRQDLTLLSPENAPWLCICDVQVCPASTSVTEVGSYFQNVLEI